MNDYKMYPRKIYKNGLVITKAQLDKSYCAFLIAEVLHGATCYLMFPNDTLYVLERPSCTYITLTDSQPPYTQFHIFVEDTKAIESVLHKASFVICK